MLRIITLLGSLFLLAFSYALYPRCRLALHITADLLVVYKQKRRLELWSKNRLIKTYKIALGKQASGAKRVEGDMRTPEGAYVIDDKNPSSAFFLNLSISYPNANDQSIAASLGQSAGGAIKIHGLRNGSGWKGRFHHWRDWTAGCIAVTNAEMEELFRAVPIDTPIMIYP